MINFWRRCLMSESIWGVRRAAGVVALVSGIATLSGCHIEGRSSRAQTLLSQLSPTLRLGEPLSDARRAIPTLRVRHPGDPTDVETPSGAGAPQPVAVIVYPGPQPKEHAAPDAALEGVEFVMTPEVASGLRQQIAATFRHPGSLACATRAIANTDSIVEWDLDLRGGALLTFPERRPDGAVPVSRLFVYTGGWRPSEALSGYRGTPCEGSR